MDYEVTSTHAETIASGRTYAPGVTVDLSDDEAQLPHNKRLIGEGVLVPRPSAHKPEPKRQRPKTEEE